MGNNGHFGAGNDGARNDGQRRVADLGASDDGQLRLFALASLLDLRLQSSKLPIVGASLLCQCRQLPASPPHPPPNPIITLLYFLVGVNPVHGVAGELSLSGG